MRSGALRHSVTIERETISLDDYGDQVRAWTPVCTVRAEVRHASGKEIDRFARIQTEITHIVTLRWMDGLDETMRLLWQGITLSIEEIGLDPTARRTMVLRCCELHPNPASGSSSSSSSSSSASGSSESSEESEAAHA